MPIPTLFARVSTLVLESSLKRLPGKRAARSSRQSGSTTRFVQLVEEMEQRMLLAGQGTWDPLGPFSASDGQVENIAPNDTIVGAVHTVLAHPTNPNILYVGATNGGVWRTDNATAVSPSWTPLTDDLPSQSIGALAFDSADTSNETVYVGIGRYSSFGRTGNTREGLFRSTDGGATWASLGGGILTGKNISGIAANGNNVVVSVNVADNFTFSNIGIFRSTDGGATFTRVSQGDGSATGLPEGASYDLVVDPQNPNTMYTNVSFNTSNGDGIYKSTDGGASWTSVGTAAMNALFGGGTSNVELAAGNSNEVYAAIINTGDLAGLFRSPDGGATWTQMDTPSTNENGIDVGLNPRGSKGPTSGTPEEIAGGQGSIHFSILADPNNANIVYVGGDRQPRANGDAGGFPNSIGASDFTGRLFRGDASQPAGSQFVHLTHSNTMGAAGGGTASSSSPHADSRDMTFDANGNIIEVDDGGVYRRTNPQSNTGDWFSITGSLQVTESHNVAWDSLSNVAMSGNQDTGSTYQPSEGALEWVSLSTADGGDIAIDNIQLAGSNQSVRYTSFQNLGAFRRTVWDSSGNLLNTTFLSPTVTGGGAAFIPNFVTPVETNMVAGGRLLIQGANALYESLDSGNTIAQIGSGATGDSDIWTNALIYGGRQSGIDNPNLVWAAAGSDVFVRTSGTGNVAAVAADPTTSAIRDLAVNSDDWSNVFVADNNQVFMTTDTGASWSDITGDLLSYADEIRSLSFANSGTNQVVIAGTNEGIFISSITATGTWIPLGLDMPNVLVFDMDYDASDDVLVAGTLGRGTWALADASDSIDAAFGPNTAPIVNDQTFSVNENSANNTIVGIVQSSDAESDPVTYAITAGNTNGAFAIDVATGVIRVANSAELDFETTPSFSLTVQVTDSRNPTLTDSATITINLNDVNDTPVITANQTFTTQENPTAGASIGFVAATDQDNDNLTYTIVGGNAGGAFAINATTGEITVADSAAIDFETMPQFALQIRVTDDGTGMLSSTSVVTIDVTNSPNLDFQRLNPLGSQIYGDLNRTFDIDGTTTEVVFDFYALAGEKFSAYVESTNPNSVILLEIVELGQSFVSNSGEPLTVSAELLPITQSYRIRVTTSQPLVNPTTLTMDSYLNTSLESLVGDSNNANQMAIDPGYTNLGYERFAVLGTIEGIGAQDDRELYTIDLSGYIGETIDVVLDGLSADFSGTTLQLTDSIGTVLATASNMPLGVDPSNYDLGILDFMVDGDGLYQLRILNANATGDYALLVTTDSTAFETEPNQGQANRDITDLKAVVGYLDQNTFTPSTPDSTPSTGGTPVSGSGDSATTPPNTTPINMTESEPNDPIGQADPAPLGFDNGESTSVVIDGNLSVPLPPLSFTVAEDDGSIPLANETGLTNGRFTIGSGFIGNGPYSTTSGDYDFYAVRNVNAGDAITVDINARSTGSSLDSVVGIYNSSGTLVASNDDFGGSLDSYLSYIAAANDDYFVAVRGYGSGDSFQSDPFDSSSGTGVASQGAYQLVIGLNGQQQDVDTFAVELNAGDVINAWNTGAGTTLTLYNQFGTVLATSTQDLTSDLPANSPLQNGGNITLPYTAYAAGQYFVSISGGTGAYQLNLDVHRPVLEEQGAGARQILFLDFNGEVVDSSRLGSTNGNVFLSGLSSYLGGWGLSSFEESALIDAILATVTENLADDVRQSGINGDFSTTFNHGDFDIEILNSRDHADPGNGGNVTRIVVGGSQFQLGLSGTGFAESNDIGNQILDELGVVLLDRLSAPGSAGTSLNRFNLGPGTTMIDLVGVGLGNIVSREAGYMFGNFPTNNANSLASLTDEEGNLANIVGVGNDQTFGTFDDVDVDFEFDQFAPSTGLTGFQNSMANVAFNLPTGTNVSDLVGPRVQSITPIGGIQSGSITAIQVVFNEALLDSTAIDVNNFELREAGNDGVFGTGDDQIIPVTVSFDGNATVTLTISAGFSPLPNGNYQLTLEGNALTGIRDTSFNLLNTLAGPNNGLDSLHEFTVVQQGFVPFDNYTVHLNAGEALYLVTSTPLNNPLHDPQNTLDPRLLVIAPSGLSVGSDDNSAGDGRNAELVIIAQETGDYTVQVQAVSGLGEYVLRKIINHPPQILDQTFSVPENSANGTSVGTVVASDVDSDNLTYAIVSGNTNGAFSINPTTGEITVNNSAALDFEQISQFDLVVSVTDDGPGTLVAMADITIQLTDVNETPTINDASFTVDEEAPVGTVVGTMTATDPDAGDMLTFSITGGNTGGAFTINATTGQITVATPSAVDFESTPIFSLTVRVTDAGGLFDEATATIFVTDVNDTPIVNDQTFSVEESAPNNTVVGTVVAFDPDNDGLTFAITSGNTNNAFAIDASTGTITVNNQNALNFEIQPTFNLTVQVTDDGNPNKSDTAVITINVLDLLDGVTIPFFDGFEDFPNSMPPSNLIPVGSPYVVSSTTGGRVYTTSQFQPRTGNRHLILDSGNEGSASSLNEVVLEVNANGIAQLNFDFDQREFFDEDNPMPATFVGSGNYDGVAISTDGNAWYRLISLTGSASTSLYTTNSFDLTQFASDNGLNIDGNFFIKLQQYDDYGVTSTGTDGFAFDNLRLYGSPSNNQPPVLNDQTFYINENSISNLIVGYLNAQDPNLGDPLTYAITGGNTNNAFTLDASTGRLRVNNAAALDFETNPVFRLNVSVTDGGTPGLTDTAVVTIVLKNLEETQTQLFYEGFESGTTGQLTTSSTNSGRIRALTTNATSGQVHAGTYHLGMDHSTSGTTGLNEAVFSFNAAGYQNVTLDFWQRETADGDNPLPATFTGSTIGDGVSFSIDGNTWHRLDSFINGTSSGVYKNFIFNVSAAAQGLGLQLNGTVWVKLQETGTNTFPSEGMTFDDIRVYGSDAMAPAGVSGIVGLSLHNGDARALVNTSSNGVYASRTWGMFDLNGRTIQTSLTGDFNGDGRDDLAVMASDGEWLVGISTGSSYDIQSWGQWRVTTTAFTDIRVLDANGDGRDDIVGLAEVDGRIWIAESRGTRFDNVSWAQIARKADAGWQDVGVGDFNNDGFMDYALRTASGRWWMGLSNGRDFTFSTFGVWSGNAGWQDVTYADYNGDGRTDIAGRAANGRWWVSLSNGSELRTTSWSNWRATAGWQDIVAGDFNGDGLDDVAGRTSNDVWWVGISDGTSFTTRYWSRWSSSVLWEDVQVGDFNGDGRADIAGRAEKQTVVNGQPTRTGGRWWYGISNGSSFTTQSGPVWDPTLTWVGVQTGKYDAPGLPVPPTSPIAPASDASMAALAGRFQSSSADQTQIGSASGSTPAGSTTNVSSESVDDVNETFGDQSLLDLLADL
ncbi:cadherin domain-containing protein [Rubinisphaera margarita]|uniref:cadherin domain-containing protein n=1 Tax=Rubinisphaera margarita TaxID=2909586 RepID=UPI001EE8DFF6|nr:cadherin domain-containing protein [Rubinisphaera margarita]MCG6154801.1 cadherin domain-containing protein [Rubinisphaera margarita]